MKRAVTVSLLLVLFLVSVVPLAQADEPPPLIIAPFIGGDDYYASEGQEVIIRNGWGSCTRGLERAFIQAASVSMEVSLNGNPWLTVEPPSRELWGPLTPQPAPSGCIPHVDTLWVSNWFYSLGALAPGEYRLRLVMTFSHQLVDGGDWDGDGQIDHFPSGVFNDRTITIHVN